jgi:chromosome segregation ATPase
MALESKFSSQVSELEQESDELKGQVEALTLKLHEKAAQVRAAQHDAEGLREELALCQEKLANMTRLKNQLSAALEHEQDQRQAMLAALESQQGDYAVEYHQGMRMLEEENAGLREESQRLRFAVGMQAERAKERKRAHEKELQAVARKLERLEAKFDKALQDAQACRSENMALQESLARHRIELERSQETQQALERLKQDYIKLRKASGHVDSVIAEKEYQNECLKQEISRLVDRFESSIEEERARSERSAQGKEGQIAALQAQCQMLMESLQSKERKLVSQGSLLRSLDSSLDKLIAG